MSPILWQCNPDGGGCHHSGVYQLQNVPAAGFSGNCARVLSSCVAHCVEFDVVVQYIYRFSGWIPERKAASQPRLRGKRAQWRGKLRGKPVVEDAMHWHSCHAPHSHCFSGCYSKFEGRPPSWITELLQKQFPWDGIVFSSKKRVRAVEVFGTKDTQRLPRARYHLRHSTWSNSCKMWLVTIYIDAEVSQKLAIADMGG